MYCENVKEHFRFDTFSSACLASVSVAFSEMTLKENINFFLISRVGLKIQREHAMIIRLCKTLSLMKENCKIKGKVGLNDTNILLRGGALTFDPGCTNCWSGISWNLNLLF